MKYNVCIIAVCYNAFEETIDFLNSISKAFNNEVNLTVIISDNSTIKMPESINNISVNFHLKIIKNDNIGYFPAFSRGLEYINKNDFDFIAISNVDLKLNDDFFYALSEISISEDIGIIAPSIISLNDGRDLNPKMIKKPSKNKIKLMMFICKYHYLFLAYRYLAKIKEYKRASKKKSQPSNKFEYMYGPHGAFFFFTKNYIKKGGSLSYKRFLFGEEGFVADQTERINLKVKHVKSLIIHDIEHGSTSLESSKFISEHHYKSYKYFLDNCFKSK